jgi:hypothetical protein
VSEVFALQPVFVPVPQAALFLFRLKRCALISRELRATVRCWQGFLSFKIENLSKIRA